MQNFKDKNGISWTIDLTLYAVKRIEAYNFGPAMHIQDNEIFIQFFPPTDKLFTEVITDPAICFGMVWCCCQDEAASRNINDELEFAKLFDGDSIERAREAFYSELPDFFSNQRITLRSLIGRYRLTQETINKKLQKKIDELLTPEAIEKLVDKEIAKIKIEA